MEKEAINEVIDTQTSTKDKLSEIGEDSNEADDTIHAFNVSNITVIECKIDVTDKSKLTLNLNGDTNKSSALADGSDSGVETGTNDTTLLRALSSNSGGYASSCGIEDCTPAQSCDSSIISCCSNYEDAYEHLARKNSTLLEDLKISKHEDGTSEGGSESSSVTGGRQIKSKLSTSGVKKKVGLNEPGKLLQSSPLSTRTRSSITPSPRTSLSLQERAKLNRTSTKTQNKLSKTPVGAVKSKNVVRPLSGSFTSGKSKTPVSTPTDDGRWPSSHSKPAPLIARSTRSCSASADSASIKSRVGQLESKATALEKYATLPRRRKEKSAEDIKDLHKKTQLQIREQSINRLNNFKKQLSSAKSLPPYARKKTVGKIKIFHETCVQTALTQVDIENALNGVGVRNVNPSEVERIHQEVQADRDHEEIERLQDQIKRLMEDNSKLQNECKEHKENITNIEHKLADEHEEKQALKEELERNSQRILSILGRNNETQQSSESNNDSLMLLEARYQTAGEIIIKQEKEISELSAHCRVLQRDLEKCVAAQKALLQQQQDLEAESTELQEFMQAEKQTLNDALRESESEVKNLKAQLAKKDGELERQEDECKHLVRISEQRRQEILGLQAKLGILETRSRELLLQQGATISGAALALTGLLSRLDGLVEQLIVSYNISEKDLEDVIFHNEAYSSSMDESPEVVNKTESLPPSPKRGSFVSAVISAIRNAATQSFIAGAREDKGAEDESSDSTDLLDSETEPCLMMENVLEDVTLPDSHSHNMISSGHSHLASSILARSESLQNLSQAILNRQMSEKARMEGSYCESMQTSYSEGMTSLSEIYQTSTLVDQVIEVDNLLTKLLKVLRIIQIDNDTCIDVLEDEKAHLTAKIQKQREVNELAAKQLRDWETLGAKLKSELQDVNQQLSRKNTEMDEVKTELHQKRQEVERLNQDICDLSTTCSKAELQLRLRDEEVSAALKEWEETDQAPSSKVLADLMTVKKEIPLLQEKLTEKDKQLSELIQEFIASRHVMSESWNQAVGEAKRQYEVIDGALETLHSIQSVVQQCPPLAKVQHDLEEASFQYASAMPFAAPDYNANAELLQAAANLLPSSSATAINSTA